MFRDQGPIQQRCSRYGTRGISDGEQLGDGNCSPNERAYGGATKEHERHQADSGRDKGIENLHPTKIGQAEVGESKNMHNVHKTS
jgi:hypothetical protein